MNVVKSIIVIVTFIVLALFSIYLIKRFIYTCRIRSFELRNLLSAIIVCSITIFICFQYAPYIYPFERHVEFKHFATIELSQENRLDGPLHWHAAYEKYGFYAESFYFNPDETNSYLGFDWPEMDFENHTYIITYGQELISLQYKIWETIDVPIRTGANAGYAVLETSFDPEKVYIYEIPKMRIENDINFTTEYIREKLDR